MVSRFNVENLSLIVAETTESVSSVVCIACVAVMIHLNIRVFSYTAFMTKEMLNHKLSSIIQIDLAENISLSAYLAIGAVSLAFSKILIKGLNEKKGHLIKAYLIYGVTRIMLWCLLAFVNAVILHKCSGMLLVLFCLIIDAIDLLIIRRLCQKMSSNECDQ